MEALAEQLKKATLISKPTGLVTHDDVRLHRSTFKTEDHVENSRRVSDTMAYINHILPYHRPTIDYHRDNESMIDDHASRQLILVDNYPIIDRSIVELTHDKTYVEYVSSCFDDMMARQLQGKLTDDEKASIKNKAKKTPDNYIFKFDMDMYINQHSFEAAMLSVSGTLAAVEKVMADEWSSAMTVLRPPGHHAHRAGKDGKPSGFCFFNNVAVAANYLRIKYGYKRILILDWDVHHGDGTQDIFKDTDEVLFISLHCFDKGMFYPEKSGDSEFIGQGKGEGYNINVAFDIFRTKRLVDEDYTYLFDTLLMPIIKEYDPEFILVSSGFDSCRGDPLADMMISPRTYYHILRRLQTIQTKIVVCLEGGYNLNNVKDGTYSVISSLLDISDQHYEQATKNINTKQKRSGIHKSFDDHFTNKTWQLGMIDTSIVIPQQFIIDQCRSLITTISNKWPSIDWQLISDSLTKASIGRLMIDDMTANIKIPNIDYIGVMSMTMSFGSINHRKFTRAISTLQSTAIDHCRLVYYDDEDVNTISIEWLRPLTATDRCLMIDDSHAVVDIGMYSIDVNVINAAKRIASIVE